MNAWLLVRVPESGPTTSHPWRPFAAPRSNGHFGSKVDVPLTIKNVRLMPNPEILTLRIRFPVFAKARCCRYPRSVLDKARELEDLGLRQLHAGFLGKWHDDLAEPIEGCF